MKIYTFVFAILGSDVLEETGFFGSLFAPIENLLHFAIELLYSINYGKFGLWQLWSCDHFTYYSNKNVIVPVDSKTNAINEGNANAAAKTKKNTGKT